jgi:hypothetical protein
MIDYLAHVAALRSFRGALASAPPSDPKSPKAVAEGLSDSDAQPGSAMLGALVDHWLQYSERDTSVEIGLLRNGAAIFQDALSIFAEIAKVRAGLETGLTTPTAPGALAGYNAAVAQLPGVASAVGTLHTQLEAFQAGFTAEWMAPTGQQEGTPVAQWAWRDVFLARRTSAFVANAQKLATTARQRAFALGTVAGAGGNICGSGYLNSVVGGPRRSHELRHRLAAYSVGAWLRDNEPQLAGTIADLQAALTFGPPNAPSLPTDLKNLAQEALHHTYPTGTPALPDLETGYSNLIEHLSLLGDFTLPSTPAPLNDALTTNLLTISSITLGADNIHPSGSGVGTNYPGIGQNESAAAVCETLLLWLLWPPAWIVALDNALGGSGPDLSMSTDEDLVVASTSPKTLSAFSSFYGMELSFWQALAAARAALVLRGLLYPDPGDLSNPTYLQFLAIPSGSADYPLLAMPRSDTGTEWPASALETPATSPSPFATASTPLTFLSGDPTHSIYVLSPTLWVDMTELAGTDRPLSENLNLDDDRGFMARCWTLAPGATMTNLPVAVVDLSYAAV